MSITFTAAERKSITRRQVNIITENEAFDLTDATLAAQKTKLQDVDNANTVFYNFYNIQASQYEVEARQMDGQVPATYSPTQLDDAAKYGVGTVFYPNQTPNVYIRSIPLINDPPNSNNTVKGRFHPISTDAQYELNILSNANIKDGIEELIDILANGISGVTPAFTTITSFTGNSLMVFDSSNFTTGDLIFVGTSGNSGIYRVTNVDSPTELTVEDILPAAVQPSSGNVDNDVVGFTNTERETLISATWQEILTSLTNKINTLISLWEGKIDAQIAALTLQNDTRVTQAAENTAALADVNNTKSIIDTWQALPNTGVGAKYTAAGISAISAEVNDRQTFIPTRITQIAVALGTNSSNALSQSGDTFTSGDLTNPYYQRYVWINIRINRVSGSLRRFYNIDQSQSKVGELKADNVAVKGQYDAYFTTTAVEFVDGSDIIYVKSASGFSIGNSVKVLSETQPELPATIDDILDNKTIRLSVSVPVTYKLSDIVRMFKEL